MSAALNIFPESAAVQRARVPEHQAASMRATRVRLYLGLLALDLMCILAAFAVAALIRFGNADLQVWAEVATCITALFLVISVLNGSYCLEVLRHPSVGAARASSSLILAFLLFFVIGYLLKLDSDISRALILLSLAFAMIGLAVVRVECGDWIKRRFRGRFTSEIVLRDGVSDSFSDEYRTFDAEKLAIRPDPGDAAMLLAFAQLTRGVDRLVIACRPEAAVHWSKMLKGADVQGEILTAEYDSLALTGVAYVDGRSSLVVWQGPLSLRQKLVKRLFDLTISIAALAILAPVFALIALAIKLDSPGPVFFGQWRVGRGNKLFRILKFRTMRVDCTDANGSVSMRRDDDRTTRVGKILRRTSIDELPQIINVVLNTMSLIGPRPHALGSLAGDQLFWHVDERYWHRHALKPGITGLAQVRGYRGSTTTREDLSDRLRADLEYVSGWRLSRDISILLRTMKVLVHPNAF